MFSLFWAKVEVLGRKIDAEGVKINTKMPQNHRTDVLLASNFLNLPVGIPPILVRTARAIGLFSLRGRACRLKWEQTGSLSVTARATWSKMPYLFALSFNQLLTYRKTENIARTTHAWIWATLRNTENIARTELRLVNQMKQTIEANRARCSRYFWVCAVPRPVRHR
jgi:hypothetical protein